MIYDDFIPPLSDFGFKNLFGKPGKAKQNLITLLNAILHEQLGFEKIVDLTLNPTENKGESPERKTTFFDIHCYTSNRHRIIVEMQNHWEPNFMSRLLYYVAEGIMQQDTSRHTGEAWDYSIDPVVGLALCNFTLPGFKKKPVAYFLLKDWKTDIPYGKQIGLVFLHLPQFTDDEMACVSELEMIIYSLKNMETIQKMDKVPFSKEKGDFYDTIALMSRVSALSEDERREYDRWRKHENMRLLREKNLKDKALAEGIAEGRAKGLEEGRAEGRAKGLEEGRAEGRAKGLEEGKTSQAWESARILKNKNMPLDFISEVTGISESELRSKL